MKYHIWTEGCQMNAADSQRVASALERLGYQSVPQAERADVIVLNTCVVRQSAEDKVIGRLTSLQGLKRSKPEERSLSRMVLGVLFLRFKDMPYAKAMLTAVRPVVVALLAYTVYTVFKKSVSAWHHGLIMVVAFTAVTFLNVHPALTILAAAVIGLIVYR